MNSTVILTMEEELVWRGKRYKRRQAKKTLSKPYREPCGRTGQGERAVRRALKSINRWVHAAILSPETMTEQIKATADSMDTIVKNGYYDVDSVPRNLLRTPHPYKFSSWKQAYASWGPTTWQQRTSIMDPRRPDPRRAMKRLLRGLGLMEEDGRTPKIVRCASARSAPADVVLVILLYRFTSGLDWKDIVKEVGGTESSCSSLAFALVEDLYNNFGGLLDITV